ncbi:MAG: hypothetical protein V4591_09065 [Bdellovibrionota bacterium]
MHVIWKRPDGFQNALPEDFRRVALSNGAQLWLHRHEQEWYPFQVSGDWSGQPDTKRLNRLINKIDASDAAWKSFLEHSLDDEIGNNSATATLASVAKEHMEWLRTVDKAVKGNAWEVEIVRCALADVMEKVKIYCS